MSLAKVTVVKDVR